MPDLENKRETPLTLLHEHDSGGWIGEDESYICQFYEDALWDFSEAVRIDPENVKGRYRRAVCHLEMVKLEMKKEGEGRFWDIEKQRKDLGLGGKENLSLFCSALVVLN
mmetsp:Transcript_6743/g.28839  ORF Transcript_6743/g.28839 Transcript_6743/m.28839 type:complete len:109 (-) Transcript_6743:940-1266(-)